MESLKAEGAFSGVAGFGEPEFFEEVFEDIDGGKAGHFSADELGGEIAGVDAPVAVGKVAEEEFVEGVAVEFDEGGFGVVAGGEVAEAGLELGDEEAGETAG